MSNSLAEPESAPGGATTGARAYLELSQVSKTYSGGVHALQDVTMHAERGEFVALVGPSGCGKSTALRIIAGLREATSGSVWLDGKQVTSPIRVGMIFQKPALLPWRTASDNILLAADLAGIKESKKALQDRARDLLQLVGLFDFADKLPGQLSGGMQQRVALCRALITDPDALLMDEPFGALDALTRDEMSIQLLEILSSAAELKTVVFVTHSIQEAVFLADRVLVMSARPGRIINNQPSVLPRPRDMDMRASPEFGEQVLSIFKLLESSTQG